MEYCGQGDLSDLIERYRKTNRPIPERYIWTIVTQIVTALYRCHNGIDPRTIPPAVADGNAASATGVLHRDLKPQNSR